MALRVTRSRTFVDVFDGFFRVSFIVQTLGIEQQDVRIADEGMLKPE